MRPTKININLKSLTYNHQQLQSTLPEAKIVTCVKANAYGHGAVACATKLDKLTDAFGVCSIEEALELYNANIKKPIVLLEGCFDEQELKLAHQKSFDIVIRNEQQFEWVKNFIESNSLTFFSRVWIKINTGMNRLGLSLNSAQNIQKYCSNNQSIGEVITMTHLHSADIDIETSLQQIRALKSLGGQKLSWCNSAATLQKELVGGDWLRAGIATYGFCDIKNKSKINLQPVMQFTSKLIDVISVSAGETVGYGATWKAKKDSTIGIVACGYADGYPRQCPSGTPVWVKNKICPLVGRVSMDMLAVDVSEVPTVAIGDFVELWGKHISVETIAEKANTISYHLFTSISKRVAVNYINQ